MYISLISISFTFTSQIHFTVAALISLWISFYLLVDVTGLSKTFLTKNIWKKVKFRKHNLPESTNMGNSLIKDEKFLIF